MDREKVIKGLEICSEHGSWHGLDCEHNEAYKDCPYRGCETGCVVTIAKDALALLKEHGAKTQGADSGMCEICSFYERAMSVKPHYNARTNWYECGACHYSMTSGMHCKGELIPAYKVGFCAKCGKAVMWE